MPRRRGFSIRGRCGRYEGREARRPAIEGWFGSLDTERVKVSFEDVRVEASAGSGLAGLTAFGTYAAIASDGAELRSMQNRLTWVLKFDGAAGAWKIIHEHTSTPISPGDTKAIFRRLP